MADDAPGFFRSLRGLATDWVQTKRKNLQAKPQTQVGSAGGIGQYEFGGQEIDQQELKDVKAMRESGGIISQVYHSKALIKFGTGAELQAEDDDLQQALNEELFSDLESLVLDIGEDAIWYPYSVGEIVETRTGDFSHIELIEPWTMLPQTDEYGDIIAWEQQISGRTAEAFDPEEIGHIIINKASGRDKTGISEVLRSKEEIETFKSNQNAMREATERLGFPFIHAKAGREGATQLNDNELRRIRNRLAEIGPGETQVTGPDVDIEQMEPATVDFAEIQTRDMKMLATASGLPIELLNEGSDGLGSGMPAELRKELLALRNEADRRKVADQFVTEFVKPVVREYTEFDHTQNITMQIDPFLDDKQDMASLIQSVSGYLTANEVRDKLGMAPIDDDELGESYVVPEDEESDEPEGGGLFGSDGGGTDFRDLQDVEDIDTGDYPEAAVENAQMALDAREETGNPNDCGTQVGWERANQLVNGEDLSEDTIGRMSNFARHEDNKEQGEEGRADCGWLMWNAWGGDDGIAWAEEQMDEFAEARENSDLASEGMEPWERDMLDLHQRIWAEDNDKQLVSFTETAVPEFVQERLRQAVIGGAVFGDIENVGGADLNQLRQNLADELTQDGWTTDTVTDAVQEVDPTVSRSQAETIARTETASVVNSAREIGYEGQGLEDDGFYWTGSIDDRTTQACEWLINETNPNHGGDPVSLSELKDLIAEAPTHDDDMQDNLARPEDFVVHPSERKTFVRDV